MRQGQRGNRAGLAALAAIVCAMALPASAAASETGSSDISQQLNTSPTDTEFIGQTFTVPSEPATDTLLHTLQILRIARGAGPFRVFVSATNGVTPTGAPLYTSPQLSGPVGPGTVTVHPNITLTPGVMYALYTEEPGITQLWGSFSNPYAGGQVITKSMSSSSWSVAPSVDMGFLAQFSAGRAATTTSASCPAPIKIGVATTCSGDVDTPGAFAVATGSIAFSTLSGADNFSSCVLNATGECTATYTPPQNSAGPQTVFAQYVGDATHLASSAPAFQIEVLKRTSAQGAAGCAPTTVTVGQSVTCTIDVTDADGGTLYTPTGSTAWSSTGAGSFSPSNTCTLEPTGVLGTARCESITYTPTAPGAHAISSTYGGDASHLPSGPAAAGTVTAVAPPPPPPAGPDCTPLRRKLKRLKRQLRKSDGAAKRKVARKVKRTRGQLKKLGC